MLQLLVGATSNPEVASSALSLLCKSVLSTIWIPHQLLLHHSHLYSYQSYSKFYIQYSNETLKKTHRWNGLNLSLWPTNIVGTRSERKRDYENSISTPPQNFPRLIISISHPLTKVASISVSAFPPRVHRLLKVWPTAVAIHHNVHSSHKWLISLWPWPSSLKPLHFHFHFDPVLWNRFTSFISSLSSSDWAELGGIVRRHIDPGKALQQVGKKKIHSLPWNPQLSILIHYLSCLPLWILSMFQLSLVVEHNTGSKLGLEDWQAFSQVRFLISTKSCFAWLRLSLPYCLTFLRPAPLERCPGWKR